MKRLILASLAAATAVAGSPAQAQVEGLLQPFLASCEAHQRRSPASRQLPSGEVLAVLLESNGVAWSGDVARAYSGTISRDPDRENTLAGSALGADLQSVAGSLYQLLQAAGDAPGPTTAISATRRPGSPVVQQAAVAYLRGELDLLTIHCPELAPPPPSIRRWIVAGDVASLSQSELGNRTFATFGYVDDRESGAESIDVDIVLSPGGVTWQGARWIPYLGYERQTVSSAPVNDLTFGFMGVRRVNANEWRWTFEYETDDQFESEQYRASLAWDPPALPCDGVARFPARVVCRYGLRLDYAEVVDPGNKASLANVEDYLRAGGWLSIDYGRPLLNGWFEASFDYELMEPLTDDEGDAAVGRISLTLAPSARSNYRFGLQYVNGEDITSLVRSEVIKATLGIRY